MQAMGKVYGNIYLTEKRSGPSFSADDEASLVILATQAGVAIANATLYAQTHQREQWLDALRDITTRILAGSTADSLLAAIAEHARNLARAEAATILTTSSTPGRLVVAAAVGAHAEKVRGQTVPTARSLSGEVMESGRPLVTEAAAADRDAYQPILRLGRVGPAIFVPFRVRGRATGTLMVANLAGGRKFNAETLRLVETFADQASVALEHVRAQADVRRVGLMEERERIAKELHDGIIQSLFAVGMNLQSTALTSGSPETAARVENAVGELDGVIRDLRNYIFGLRPGILADRQLNQALEAIAEDASSTANIPIAIDVDAAVSAALSPRSQEIVQLTREALSNVTRHARARHVTVRLARSAANAVLTIQDDGVGFDARKPAEGNGMRNMRERTVAIGGKLRVTSANGKGTTLRFTFPA